MLEKDCQRKMIEGEKVYGKFNAKTDKKNMLKEIREEAVDIVNYSRMHRAKHPSFDYLIENLAKEIYNLTFNVK